MKNAIKELVVGFIIGSLTFWFVEYNVREQFGIPLKYYLIFGSGIGVFIFSYFLNKEFIKATFFIMLGIMAAQMVRIIFDLVKDSKTHNLLPFELFDTTIVCFLSGIVASVITLILKRPKAKQEQ